MYPIKIQLFVKKIKSASWVFIHYGYIISAYEG
jgi:hydrogenase maturation factor